MNWSDERYAKLYVRKTATWITWPWEARAVFPQLLKEADGTGLIDTGTRAPEQTLAIMISFPVEVVRVGVAAMVESGTIELTDRGYLITNYIEAQEATKTPAQKKRDQRERDRAKARVTTEPPVTDGHPQSPAVTESHRLSPSSPAQPSPPPAHHHHQPSPPPPPAQRPRSPKKPRQADLPEVVPPPPPKPPTRVGAILEMAEGSRGGRLMELGLDPDDFPDEAPDFGRTAGFVSAVGARYPDWPPEKIDQLITSLHNLWLNQEFWSRTRDKEGKPAVPYPWGAFITEGQWRKIADKEFPVEVAA